MKLGTFEIFPVSDGRFRLDGGAMFGIVPRVIWEQCCPADECHRILLSLTCLLVHAHDKWILIDTGIGMKGDAKFQRIYAIDHSVTLLDSLAHIGMHATDIDLVILTHLHFDHAGGATSRDADGHLVPTFPRAIYYVQRGEFEDATHPNERTRASYRPDNILPLNEHRKWELVDGTTELLPGISVVVTPGHTPHHQSVKVESEGQVALFLGDLIPTVAHLPLPYIMGYDVLPLQTLETKRALLEQAVDERWLLIFEHDPQVQMGYVRKDEAGKYRLASVEV
ncbi:MAG: MBL fold metallo-hydrolase [Nitrospirae bacterium]|nr:MAG: MBL fold metallo-hydrolase [Nitrospirota bacterium]